MYASLNSNLMAANTARNLNQHYANLATSTRRLSSGLRINSAADDAAGLAIRELMRADIAAFHQGARNANDAISMLQVADGALAIIDEKLIRMKELAEQAATGTYDSTQRLMIDSEFQAMASEIDRIANATDFNGIHLLDGSLSGIHNGSKLTATGKIKIHFGTANDSAEDYYYVSIGDCTSKGLGIKSSEIKEVTKTIVTTKTINPLYAWHWNISEMPIFTDDQIIKTNDNNYLHPDTQEGGFEPYYYKDDDGNIYTLEQVGVTTNLPWENREYYLKGNKPDVLFCDINGNELNYDNGLFYNEVGGWFTTTLPNGNGDVIDLYPFCDVNGIQINVTQSDLFLFADCDGTGSNVFWKKFPPVKLSPILDITEETVEEDITTKEIIDSNLVILTQDAAQKALVVIDNAIVSKDKIRAQLGNMQSRLENTISNLNIQAENLQAAESRISDVDVATEMTNFVRNQILTQSAVAMLGQANSMPQMLMQLISR